MKEFNITLKNHFRPGLESCSSEKIRVAFSSVIKIVSKSSLVLTNVDSQDELLLVGLENVLNDVTVTVSNPHFMYAGRPYNKGDLRTWPIGLKSVFWTEGTPGNFLDFEPAIYFIVSVHFRSFYLTNMY